jgi:uncharacterized protein with GYD domain
MVTYVTLCRWTEQGIRNVKESPARYDAFKELAESMGCKVKSIHLVTGPYDLVVITEGPDDETMAKLSLATGSQGGVRTETLRAFTESEYRKIIDSL